MTLHLAAGAVPTVETPAASMQTFISPSTAPVGTLSIWRTVVPAGASGPVHVIDVDHVLHVIDGEVHAVVAGEEHVVPAGDCLVLPAGALRQVTGGPTGATLLTVSAAPSRARVGAGEPVPVPWAN